MAEATLRRKIEFVSPSRQRVMGSIFLTLAFWIWFLFSRTTESGALTTFSMTPGGTETTFPDWVFTTLPVLNVLAFLCAGLGAYQLFRGFGRRTNLVLGLTAGLFIFGFLSWATSGQSINLAGLLRSTIVRAVPITLGAFAALLNELSGLWDRERRTWAWDAPKRKGIPMPVQERTQQIHAIREQAEALFFEPDPAVAERELERLRGELALPEGAVA